MPNNLMALMSAENLTEKTENGVYEFKMTQPIPSYLLALAVGDVEFRSVGEHTGVYATPDLIDAAEYEFAEMENLLVAAEGLYGKYSWERYDLLVLPAAFPFGGMENPRLTFATPTIIAGDRSLVSLVAHELAHSWSAEIWLRILHGTTFGLTKASQFTLSKELWKQYTAEKSAKC